MPRSDGAPRPAFLSGGGGKRARNEDMGGRGVRLGVGGGEGREGRG